MDTRLTLIAVATLAMTLPAHAQRTAQIPRLSDGRPDLQGTWVNFDDTPFEAPGGGPAAPAANAGVNPPAHWTEHDSPKSARRRSMVVDPPDGRVPVLPWAEAKRDYDLAHIGDSWIHETPWVRCITRGFPAGMFPAGYNNAYQIVQVPGLSLTRRSSRGRGPWPCRSTATRATSSSSTPATKATTRW